MAHRKTKKASPGAKKPRTEVPPARREDTATAPSGTAVAAEAYRTGVVPLASGHRPAARPGEDNIGGERESRVMDDTYVGDEAPGGSMMTPENDRVDDIGRAMGVAEADSGALRSSSEILDRRDQHRAQQDVPDPTTRER